MAFLGDKELDQALATLVEQWNIAERRIKQAEQIRGQVVVSSAIFELRYAGRKITDVINLALQAKAASKQQLLPLIADATEDCVKAKHDAIDSMMTFVTIWFDELESRVTLTKVVSLFPDYLDKTAMIASIQEMIAESRQHRNQSRDAIYDEIERSSYNDVLDLYTRMRLSRDRIQADVDREKADQNRREAREKRNHILGIGGIIIGLVGAAAAIIAIL